MKKNQPIASDLKKKKQKNRTNNNKERKKRPMNYTQYTQDINHTMFKIKQKKKNK